MDLAVFYSWQDDQPNETCRYFIRGAAQKAVHRIASESIVQESPRLDHDTKGQSGIPGIADTIFSKIEKAAVFLGDVTFVGKTKVLTGTVKEKMLPNPNVLVELGYAARSIGWERIVCVFNDFYGSIDDQIFNLKHRRNPICYRLGPDEKNSIVQQRDCLSARIEEAIRSVLRAEHCGVEKILTQLDAYSQVFLRKYANQDMISPPPTNRVVFGVAANDLDTPGFNTAVSNLHRLEVIETVVDPNSHSVIYKWTPIGCLVLQKLGLRNA
ncbi:MAG: hypothetical protein JW818_01675 [Pirellulales bacterium]|nr:hypothetical protein [Pirellulales bacterium]